MKTRQQTSDVTYCHSVGVSRSASHRDFELGLGRCARCFPLLPVLFLEKMSGGTCYVKYQNSEGRLGLPLDTLVWQST